MAFQAYLRALLPSAGLVLFSLGLPAFLPAQGSNLGIPKGGDKKKARQNSGGSGLIIPKRPQKKKKDKGQGRQPIPTQKAQDFEIPQGMPGLKSFVAALTTEENIGKEELVAMYDLVSAEGKSQLMLLARKMDAASVAMLSRVYAAIGEKAVLPLLLARLRNAKFGKYTDTIVESVVLLAEGRGIHVAIEMLGSRNRSVRAAAVSSIRSRLALLNLDDLTPILDSSSKPARAAAVQLLVGYLQRYPEKDIQPLVDCLGHKDGKLRNEAAKGLLAMMSRAEAPLLAILKTKNATNEWYLAALLLGIQGLLEGKDLLPVGVIEVVANLPSTATPMKRGVSSVLLGMDLFKGPAGKDKKAPNKHDVEEVIKSLIDTIGGKTWYPEYALIHDTSRGVTAILTGKAFGSDSIRWRAWWGQVHDGFRPFTATVPLDDLDIQRARLIYEIDGVIDAVILGPKAVDPASTRKHGKIRLTVAGFKHLYERMSSRGFLDMQARFEARKGYAIDRAMTIESGSMRAFDGFHGEENPRLNRLRSAFDEVRAKESWQRYLPPQLGVAESEQWWGKHAVVLDGLLGKERESYILDLACTVLPSLPDEVRAEALTWMRGLARENEDLFGGAQADALLTLAKNEKAPGAQVETSLEILAMTGDDAAFEEILTLLLARPDLELSLVLPRLLVLGDASRLLKLTQHESADVRGVSAREIAKLKYEKAYPSLIELLKDKDTYVRATAAQSCGLLSLASASAPLEALTKDPVPAVQQSALLALAQIGGDNVYRCLAAATTSPHKGVRIAAIRGLAALSDPQAPSTLLDIAEAHYPEDLSLYALFGLSRRGGGALRAEVRLRMRRRIPEGLRKEYLYLLGEMQDPEPAVVDFLLAEFKRGRTSSRCCRILAAISGRDWCNQAERATKYAEWFQANRNTTQQEWFLSALREQGFKTTLTRRDLMAGAKLALFEELCRIVTEAPRWELRALAANFLRERSGKDFGNVLPDTRQGALDALAERYRAYVRSKNAVGGR